MVTARPGGSEARVEGARARAFDAAKKYVVSSTLERVDWDAELVRGDLGAAVQQLGRKSGSGLSVGGVALPQASAGMQLIAGGPGADVVRGPADACRPEAREPAGALGGGGAAVVPG